MRIDPLLAALLALPASSLGLPAAAAAAAATTATPFGWTSDPVGWAAVAIFVLAYALVVLEERIHLRKSKPVMFGAAPDLGPDRLEGRGDARTSAARRRGDAFDHVFVEFGQLFFFLVVAMSYVSAMTERNVFEALRAELVSRGFSLSRAVLAHRRDRVLPVGVLDNLTTALIMSAVILAVGAGNIALRLPGLRQPGGRRQRRRRLERLRRHHHADGVAGAQGGVLRVLPHLRARRW